MQAQSELRSCIFATSLIINNRTYQIIEMGDVKLTCKCGKIEPGFCFIGKLSDSPDEFIIFQSDVKACHESILVFKASTDMLNEIRQQIKKGRVKDDTYQTYWFESNFVNFEECIHQLNRFFICMRGQPIETLTGGSLAISFKRIQNQITGEGNFEGQITILPNYSQKELLEKEMRNIFPSFRLMKNDTELEKKFDDLVRHDVSALQVLPFVDSGMSAEQFFYSYFYNH